MIAKFTIGKLTLLFVFHHIWEKKYYLPYELNPFRELRIGVWYSRSKRAKKYDMKGICWIGLDLFAIRTWIVFTSGNVYPS